MWCGFLCYVQVCLTLFYLSMLPLELAKMTCVLGMYACVCGGGQSLGPLCLNASRLLSSNQGQTDLYVYILQQALINHVHNYQTSETLLE